MSPVDARQSRDKNLKLMIDTGWQGDCNSEKKVKVDSHSNFHIDSLAPLDEGHMTHRHIGV